MDEAVAKKHKRSNKVPSSVDKRTANLVVEEREGKRGGSSLWENQQLLVLLVGSEDKRHETLGQHEQDPNGAGSRDSVQRQDGITASDKLPSLLPAELSFGEYLTILRRRNNLSQRTAARLIGIPRNEFASVEREEIILKNTSSLFLPSLGELEAHEKCLIFRKRSGWTILECANQIGISRYWYNMMELGKAPMDRLIEYWVQNEG